MIMIMITIIIVTISTIESHLDAGGGLMGRSQTRETEAVAAGTCYGERTLPHSRHIIRRIHHYALSTPRPLTPACKNTICEGPNPLREPLRDREAPLPLYSAPLLNVADTDFWLLQIFQSLPTWSILEKKYCNITTTILFLSIRAVRRRCCTNILYWIVWRDIRY